MNIPPNTASAGESAQHTPGPWRYLMTTDTMPNFSIKASLGFGGPRIALVNYFAGKPSNQEANDWSEGEANAQLIASAPELSAKVAALTVERDALKQDADRLEKALKIAAARMIPGCDDIAIGEINEALIATTLSGSARKEIG